MKASQFTPANLLSLPDLQRNILTHLLRQGPAGADALAQAVGAALPVVRDALDELERQGTVTVSDGGQYRVALGHSRRRTMPAELCRSLLASDRCYSQQEIATLHTSIPFLKFARARLGQFADHGYGHALRVKSFVNQLSYLMGLTPTERHLLRAAALLHDVGNAVDRSKHNLISQQAVMDLTASGELPFSSTEAELVGLLCRWHRREYEPDREDHLRTELIRTGLLASILRVSDAFDIDQRRFDYTRQLMQVLEYFYPGELPFWTGHTEILGVRIRCRSKIMLQVFVRPNPEIEKNLHIAGLREDLASTPLDWAIELIPVRKEDDVSPGSHLTPTPSLKAGVNRFLKIEGGQGVGPERALLVFPFEPHSVVMAALTRAQLFAARAEVELLCYPDTSGGSARLWKQVLSEVDPEWYGRLVVIGDRPDPTILQARQSTTEKWQAAGAEVSWLNRHEGNWSGLPALAGAGAEIILGGDWAFFSGQNISLSDVKWGHIAALCTRDPTLPLVGIAPDEMAVAQGLLKTVYDAASHAAEDTAGWSALARPILDRIAGKDRNAGWNYFLNQSADFSSTLGRVVVPPRVVGRVLLFEDSPDRAPQSNYWMMEAAIEAHGRILDRSICFNTPYAIALRDTGEDTVELLAMNHWREEKAIPIRLLCPPDLDPPPAGHEACVLVCLPAHRARAIARGLVDACNQSLGEV